MKIVKLAIASFFIIYLSAISAIADSSTTIYTQKGSAVPALLRDEFTSYYISYYNQEGDNYVSTHNLQATRVGDSSRRYNCHAYAWYLSFNGSLTPVWINNPYQQIFWNDASFVSCAGNTGARVAYASADHSAVYFVNNTFVSKWGALGRYLHLPGNDPYYNGQNLGYNYRCQNW